MSIKAGLIHLWKEWRVLSVLHILEYACKKGVPVYAKRITMAFDRRSCL